MGDDRLPWEYASDVAKGKYQKQRGVGEYTLCGKCNSNTGHWYGSAFVDFVVQGYREQAKTNVDDKIKEIYFQQIYPLRIIKQIATMFFSINSPNFSDAQQSLRDLVLSRDRRGIDASRCRIYIYYLHNPVLLRRVGVAAMLNTATARSRIISELCAPPFGYVLELDPKEIDSQMCDITYFANEFGYDICAKRIALRIPILTINTPFPIDFRSRRQVFDTYIKNKLESMGRIHLST